MPIDRSRDKSVDERVPATVLDGSKKHVLQVHLRDRPSQPQWAALSLASSPRGGFQSDTCKERARQRLRFCMA